MDKKIVIDKDKCIHCGLCLKDCVAGCLEFDDEKFPKYRANGKEDCFACQHCLAICPKGALTFGDKNPENSKPVNYGNSDDLLNLIKSRRSIRYYKNEDIPPEKLDKIIEMLPFVPTGRNVDCLHFSIVETKAKMDKIRSITDKNGYDSSFIFRNATGLIAVSVDKSKAAKSCETIDPVIALSYVDLYAQSLGVGTLWCGLAYDAALNIPEFYSMLRIPEEYTLNFVMLLGIPDVKYQRTIQPEQCSVSIIK